MSEIEMEDHAMEDTLAALRIVQAPAGLRPSILRTLELVDLYFPFDTPLGEMFLAYNKNGVSAVMRAPDAERFEESFRIAMGRPIWPAPTPPEPLAEHLRQALRGEPTRLEFDLRSVSEFERAVLLMALKIPRGEIRPYAWIAQKIGHPRAARAVGSALARNPIPLLIPCHRVVRSDGTIGNYGLGGRENKRAILQWEGVDPDQVESLARAGVRYIGSDTTHIYCYPTCRHARRVTDVHRHSFRSAAEAEAQGYRTCRVCQPA